jgi:Family of unknown function (DUF5989)
MTEKSHNDFARAASETRRGGLYLELWHFIRGSKKWWLIPFLIPIVVMGALMLLAGTGAAPFIYTLF